MSFKMHNFLASVFFMLSCRWLILVEEKYSQGGPLVQGSPRVPVVLEVPAISTDTDRWEMHKEKIHKMYQEDWKLHGHHVDVVTFSRKEKKKLFSAENEPKLSGWASHCSPAHGVYARNTQSLQGARWSGTLHKRKGFIPCPAAE